MEKEQNDPTAGTNLSSSAGVNQLDNLSTNNEEFWQNKVRDVGGNAVKDLLKKKAGKEPLTKAERETLWRLEGRKPRCDATAYVARKFSRFSAGANFQFNELPTISASLPGSPSVRPSASPSSTQHVTQQGREDKYPPVWPSYDMNENGHGHEEAMVEDIEEVYKEMPTDTVQTRSNDQQFAIPWSALRSYDFELNRLNRELADLGKKPMITWVRNKALKRPLTRTERRLLRKLTFNNMETLNEPHAALPDAYFMLNAI